MTDHPRVASAPLFPQAALATILHQDGSTPRTAGARMLVFAHGGIEGTVGGGRVEAEIMALARQALADGQPRLVSFDLTGQADLGLDMICGGRLEVLVEPLASGTREAFAALEGHLLAGRRAAMVATLPATLAASPSGLPPVIRRDVLSCEGGVWTADPGADAALVPLLAGQAGQARQAWEMLEGEGERRLLEIHAPASTLYLFGAGHVALATATVAHAADFRVAVLDDRPEFANAARFPMAARVLVPPSFEQIYAWPDMASERLGDHSFIAILTRGHRHDATVLAQTLRALPDGVGWIGMIGSRTKREATYARLRQDGIPQAALDRVHCPIGLAIGAQTPGEIAVSIVAQCIQHRAGAGL